MRKGQQQTFFYWVSGVVILILVIISVQAIGKYLYPSSQVTSGCRATIELMDKEQGTVLSYFQTGTKIPLACETNWVGNITLKEKDFEDRKEEVLDKIVPLMGDCWYQFGEGKLDPFESHWASQTEYCFICSRFIVETNEGSMILSESDFSDYLRDHNRGVNSYESFFNDAFFGGPFINSIESEAFGDEVISTDTLTLVNGFDYAVVFYGFPTKKVLKATDIGESKYFTFITEYENINNVACEELVKKKRTE